jgi:hypothetical protein
MSSSAGYRLTGAGGRLDYRPATAKQQADKAFNEAFLYLFFD